MKVLVVISSSPFKGDKAKESVDLSLSLAAFDHEVSLLFKGEGLLCLLEDHQPKSSGLKDYFRILKALDLYEIESVYAFECQQYPINQLKLSQRISPLWCTADKLQELLASHEMVFHL